MTMDSRQRADLDNYITGHYGEDQFADQPSDEDCWRCGGRVNADDEKAELAVPVDGQTSLNTAAGDMEYDHVLVHVNCMQDGDRELLA